MRIWIRSRRSGRLAEAREVTFVAESRNELRALADFLTAVADLPDERWQAGDGAHEHFGLRGNGRSGEADVIVMCEEPKG